MSAPPAQLSLRHPDDWHVHLRDGALLQAELPNEQWHHGKSTSLNPDRKREG